MTDPQDRIEYLLLAQKQNETLDLLIGGVKLITQMGPEGIREAANSHPEIVLTAIESMADIIAVQRDEINKLTEYQFEIYDVIEKAANANQ